MWKLQIFFSCEKEASFQSFQNGIFHWHSNLKTLHCKVRTVEKECINLTITSVNESFLLCGFIETRFSISIIFKNTFFGDKFILAVRLQLELWSTFFESSYFWMEYGVYFWNKPLRFLLIFIFSIFSKDICVCISGHKNSKSFQTMITSNN